MISCIMACKSESPQMSKKQSASNRRTGTLTLTRRDVLALGAAAATSLYLPSGLIRTASAQTSGVQYNQNVIGQLPDFYISPTGTGTASAGGTAADPWPITMLNDPTAISRYVGKVVGLMDGTYSLYDIMGLPPAGGFSGWNLLGIIPGTATQPTTIVSQTPQGAVIDGQRDAIFAAAPTLDWGEGLLGPSTSSRGQTGAGITIDGLKFQGGNYRYITNYGGYGRGGNGNNGCDNLTVRNCWFTDLSYITCQAPGRNCSAFYSEGQNHIYVQNCRFDNIDAPSDTDRQACIQFYSPTDDTRVEQTTCIAKADGGNVVYWKCGPAPGHTNAVACYNYIDASAFTSSPGAPIMADGSTVPTDTLGIYNNVLIAGDGTACLWLDNSGAGASAVEMLDLHDNTFVGNWSTRGLIYDTSAWSSKPSAVKFYNNILAPSSGGGGGLFGDFDIPEVSLIVEVNYNLYPNSVDFGVGPSGTTYTSLASWRAGTSSGGHAADVNSAQGNPLFVASGTEAAYYQLGSGSPALTLAADGGEIGAWRGASQVGCSFGGGTVLALPDPPQLSVS